MGLLANENAISSGGYTINNSVRLRSSATAYLNRTPASAGNRKTWTWSGWIKRGALGSAQTIFNGGAGTTDATWSGIYFDGNNCIQIGGYVTTWRLTTQVFRDPSAWYHIVVAFDTTQATATDRVKLYINGSQVTAFGTTNNPTLNTDYGINQSALHDIGYQSSTAGLGYFDGYLSEVNFIDGQALTPSSFGATDPITGVWAPAKYTGTYGTNGFYLNFSSIATTSGSNTGLGKDFSGNGNYWNTNNISVTSGTTYDAMIDSPTMGASGTQPVGNYAVINPLWKDGTVSITQGNLNVSSGNYGGFSTLTIPTNSKYYAEFTVTTTEGNQGVGILKAANAYSGVISQTDMFGANAVTYYCVNGNKYVLGGGSTAYGSSWGTVGDVIGIAVDTVNNQITFYKNNVSQGVITGLTSGIEWVFGTGNQTSSGAGSWNFGQQPWKYSPPSGYVALCTTNLPDSTVLKGSTYMNAVLQAGSAVNTGANLFAQSGYTYGLAWGKDRAAVNNHQLVDTLRGTSAVLISNSTGAETTYTAPTSGDNCVAWVWNSGTTGASNTSGSITSTVSVNTTAGFSVVTWTPTTSAATIGHGLGVAPKMIIQRPRNNVDNWQVYHASIGAGKYILLNTTGATLTNATVFSTTPTSSVFDPGTGYTVSNGYTASVAYCFAEISGFSKAFSYAGNGSADGPMVYLGFLPRFVLLKRTDTTGDWYMWDTARNTYDVITNTLLANSSAAETSATSIDALSNGFKPRNTTAGFNASGGTYVGFAWATNPFKNSNAF